MIDLHVHIEVQLSGSDMWHHYAAPRVLRDPDLWGLFSEEISATWEMAERHLGLPEDLTAVTEFAAERAEDHSFAHCWLSAAQTTRLASKWAAIATHKGKTTAQHDLSDGVLRTRLFGHALDGDLPDGVDDFRLVCWLSE